MSDFDPLNTGSHEQVRATAEQRSQMAADTEASDLDWLMSEEKGRRIVWRLLERAGVFRTSFNSDASVMAFREGTRNEGLRVLGQIHALCPDRYIEMVREQNARNADNE